MPTLHIDVRDLATWMINSLHMYASASGKKDGNRGQLRLYVTCEPTFKVTIFNASDEEVLYRGPSLAKAVQTFNRYSCN